MDTTTQNALDAAYAAIDTYKADKTEANLNAAMQAINVYTNAVATRKRNNKELPDLEFFTAALQDKQVLIDFIRSELGYIGSSIPPVSGAFTGMIMTLEPNSGAVIIPILPGSNLTVDWGDGTVETYTGNGGEGYNVNLVTKMEDPSATLADFAVGDMPYHEYADSDLKDIKLSGSCEGFYIWPIVGGAFSTMVRDIKQWGDLDADYSSYAYGRNGDIPEGLFLYAAGPYEITATDAPIFRPNTNLEAFFMSPGLEDTFNSDIGHWDMSNVVNVDMMFTSQPSYSHDLSGWDLTHITLAPGITYPSDFISGTDAVLYTSGHLPQFGIMAIEIGTNPMILNLTSDGSGAVMTPFQLSEGAIVQWGDEDPVYVSTVGTVSHRFPEGEGTYTVKISGGVMPHSGSTFPSNLPGPIEVVQWGDYVFKRLDSAFYGKVLSITATDQPTLDASVTSAKYMFQLATILGGHLNLDLTGVTDVTRMFNGTNIPVGTDMSGMNVSTVQVFTEMFNSAHFDSDISAWNMTSATRIDAMFQSTGSFNTPITGWSLPNVTNAARLFYYNLVFNNTLNNWSFGASNIDFTSAFSSTREFNQSINSWSFASSATTINAAHMFKDANKFNQPVTLNCSPTSTAYMFHGTKAFNQPVSFASLDQLTSAEGMYGANMLFNQPINFTGATALTNMTAICSGCPSFNSPVTINNLPALKTLDNAFYACGLFNHPVDLTGNTALESTSQMFGNCGQFNSPVTTTGLTSLSNVQQMFFLCEKFNQPVNMSDSPITNTYNMFSSCSDFNSPVTMNLSVCTDMRRMFSFCSSFNETLTLGSLSNVFYANELFYGCTAYNQPFDLSTMTTAVNLSRMFMECTNFNSGDLNFPSTNNIQTINGILQQAKAFNGFVDFNKLTKCTDFSYALIGCTSFNQPIEIVLDNGIVANAASMVAGCTSFNSTAHFAGGITRTDGLFSGCTSLNSPVTFSLPDLVNAQSMFNNCSSFNQPVDLSGSPLITNYSYMFKDATVFNSALSLPMGNVTTVSNMFNSASAFNQDVTGWDMSNVSNFDYMFHYAYAFSQDLSGWNVASATTHNSFSTNVNMMVQPVWL